MKIRASKARGDRCAYCRDGVDEADEIRCPDCQVVLHRGCRSELAGCPTLGCEGIKGRVITPLPYEVEREAEEPQGVPKLEGEALEAFRSSMGLGSREQGRPFRSWEDERRRPTDSNPLVGMVAGGLGLFALAVMAQVVFTRHPTLGDLLWSGAMWGTGGAVLGWVLGTVSKGAGRNR